MCDSKTVPLIEWVIGLYPDDEWDLVGYSEYGDSGIPKYAELRRKEVENVQDA